MPAAANAPGPGTSSGWRVAAVAGPAAEWLRGWVQATEVAPDPTRAADLVDDVGGHLDVLVVGRVATDDRAGVVALADRAREADAFVVGVANGGMPWAGFEDLCDVVLTDDPGRSAARAVAAPQPVDPTVVNPTLGFRWSGTGLLTVCTGEGIDPIAVTAALAAAGVESQLVGVGTSRPSPMPSTSARDASPAASG